MTVDSPSTKQGRLLLVRLSGELSTKGRETRKRFVIRLLRNMRDAFKTEGITASVVRTHDRIFIETSDAEAERALATAARIFGVQSVSRVIKRSYEGMPDLIASGVELFADAVRDKSFAVRARRVGTRNDIPMRTRDLAPALGEQLLRGARCVDLANPEVSVHVEIMPGQAYFFSESQRGYGGLPLGVEGRAVALVSGGFDSAVAAWQLMKRGVALDYVFCNLGGRTHQMGTLRVMEVIAKRWSYGFRPRFHAVDFAAVTENLQANTMARYHQVILKRLMLRAAETVAREVGAVAIITGDAVGQVSSQTLHNMAAISEAATLPILRPLVGMNKDEILAQAREIGTFDLSKVVGEYCALVPRKPATAATLPTLLSEETRLDPSLLETAVLERSYFDLRQLDLAALDIPELEVDEIPADAITIDLRSKQAYQAWHYPDAVFLDFASALRAYPSMSRDARYVLYCEFGLKSAHLAEMMREAGFDASHFKGGSATLMRRARGDARDAGIG
jgi:thiamine biosynthesis protein ThiI